MADLISRAAAIKGIGELIREYRENGQDALADGMILARRYGVKCLPAVDAVQVVRCKDCKCRNTTGKYPVCELDSADPCERTRYAEDDDWFCADGERRDDDGSAD